MTDSESQAQSYFERLQQRRDELPTDAKPLYDDLIENNVMPRLAAATALYAHKLRIGEDVTQPAIGEQYDTTQITISRWFQWLMDNSENITPDDFDFDITAGSHTPTSK